MTTAARRFVPHIAIVAVSSLVLIAVIAYPFLPGRYDKLAVALSTMAQVFGVAGLVLVPVGILWIKFPARRLALSLLSVVLASAVALAIVVAAAASVGLAFALLVLAACGSAIVRWAQRVRQRAAVDDDRSGLLPLLLIWVPVVTVVSQVGLAYPLTEWSRGRTMANADALIADIEQYHTRYGRFPEALEALHTDYSPGVVGVARYFYSPQGTTYNVTFEQPRFLLDRIGARERVVYNPRDEHRAYGHTRDLLEAPDATGPGQGWYAAGEAGRPHWMYFLFD